MGFFDFLDDLPQYRDRTAATERMNSRHRFLIADFLAEIEGARVLDLGAHDGRWSYAFAGAGATEVVAVEARASVAADFAVFPDAALRDRVTWRVGDVFDQLQAAVAAGETYDIVAIFGLLYHVMDHYRLLTLVRQLSPRLILIDSEFLQRSKPVTVLTREKTDNPLNAAEQYPGQRRALVATPSSSALEMMADALDYQVIWSDWDRLPENARRGVADYFRGPGQGRLRATCAFRPRAG